MKKIIQMREQGGREKFFGCFSLHLISQQLIEKVSLIMCLAFFNYKLSIFKSWHPVRVQ